MENYGYSYPDSGGSSPRSREIEFENPPPSWEEQSLPGDCKVKFLVSYGGKIHPRSHDNQLAYVGGETKILAVSRNIKFSHFLAKLAGICDGGGDNIAFKYQLPGEELDALISVTNDDDLEHMMHEYDRLYRGSAKPARLRLFIFPVNRSGFGSGTSDTRSERERFVHDPIHSGPVQGVMDSSAVAPPPPPPHQPRPVAAADNVDFLLGLEKGGVGAGVAPPPQAVKVRDPVPDPEIRVLDERFARSDPQIDARIQEMSGLQIAAEQQRQQMYRQKVEDSIVGGYAGDGYVQRLPEKLPPATIPAGIPCSVPAQTTYWQPEKNIGGGGGFPATMGYHEQQQHQPHQHQQQVYMIHAPAAGMYHAPMVRPVNGQAGQGYYQVAQPQRIPSDMLYREQHQQQQQQQVYNMVPPQMSSPPPPTVPVSLAPKMGAPYAEGSGMPVRPAAVNSVGVTTDAAGYTQVMYDSATGRQMYHFTTAAAAPGGGVVTSSYQGVPASAAAANAEARAVAGGLTAEGKTAPKVLPTSAPV